MMLPGYVSHVRAIRLHKQAPSWDRGLTRSGTMSNHVEKRRPVAPLTFNPSMNKQLHTLFSVGSNYLHRWSLEVEKSFYPTLYWACGYLSMLGFESILVSKEALPITTEDTTPCENTYTQVHNPFRCISSTKHRNDNPRHQTPLW